MRKSNAVARIPAYSDEKAEPSVPMKRWELLFAKIRRMFTAQKLFFYRNEAQRFDSEAHLKKSIDRNYYFRNF